MACSMAPVVGGGLAERVEHHEVVDDAVVADAGRAHARLVSLRA